MGKKNKKAKSVAAEAESGMPRHVRREVLEIVNQLLESEHWDLPCYCLQCLIQYWIIIGSDRRPETKQGIEGKIDRFRSRRLGLGLG